MLQGDIVSARNANNGKSIPFTRALKSRGNVNTGTRVRNVPYAKNLNFPNDLNTPKILIPANPNRISYVLPIPIPSVNSSPIFNLNFLAYFSFGYPLKNTGPWAGNPGLPINQYGVIYPFFNYVQDVGVGTISIDDIYVTIASVPTPTVTAFDVGFLGYEGTLAVECNQQVTRDV